MQERSRKIFRDDGRALIVPFDHTPPGGIMSGWEDPAVTLARVIEGGPDAIMTTYGILKQFRGLMAGKVATLLRLDGGMTFFREQWNAYTQWRLLYSVEDALRIGADGVIVMGFFGAECELDTIEIIARVATDCERWNVPLAVEALPCPGPRVKDIYDPEAVAAAARLGAEYGADFIKTYYTGSAESFRRVTACCPVPVLIAGGPKMATDRDVLETAHGMLEGGGAGLFCGRNVWQHRDPAAMTRALSKILHEGASVDDALEELSGG
ncbi:MAG TPA: fructose-bisphosphate aldolase [Anaerolineae bacterium]|nr:fructose-bisphosphate aldolase [Anaerolineae bacterium]